MSLAGQGLGHLCLSPCATGACLLQFYGYLSQQQNMMQDYVRTGTYQRAILQNHTDFKDKVSGSAGAPPPTPLPAVPTSLSVVSRFFLLIDFIFTFFGLQKQNLCVGTQGV